jgi:hypothetical protein
MQLKTDKKRVEVLLDDRDLNEILSGRSVMIPELGANDQRPLVVSRWLNPELKIINRANDLKALEILTGKNPVDMAKGNAFSTVSPLNAPKPVEINSRPFALEDKEDGTSKLGQTVPFSEARKETSARFPRSGPSQFGRNFNVKGGREDKGIPGGSKENRQEADNSSPGLAGEDNERGESK